MTVPPISTRGKPFYPNKIRQQAADAEQSPFDQNTEAYAPLYGLQHKEERFTEMTAGGTEAILSMAIPAMKMGLSAAQQSNEQAARDADSRSKIEQIQQAQKLDARRRREQLRHALAARRARFGAQGISSSGSAEAVLAGLATEAERQDAEERALANTRISRINDQSSYARRRSLLDSYGSLSQMAVGLVQRQPSRNSLIGY